MCFRLMVCHGGTTTADVNVVVTLVLRTQV